MYYKLANEDYETLKKLEELCCSDYDIRGNFIPVECLMFALYDLLGEYHNKEEELEDLKQDMEDNYKPIAIDYGLSDRDFY